jgi:hypothetical protein
MEKRRWELTRPVFASLQIATKWQGLKAYYDPPSQPTPSRMFYSQGSSHLMLGPIHLCIVWSNDGLKL